MMSHDENVGWMIDAWKLMVGRIPGNEIVHAGGVASMFSHARNAFLNVSIIDGPAVETAAFRGALATMRNRARGCAEPSISVICEPWAPADWRNLAADEGFGVAMTLTGMATPALTPPRRPCPEMEVRRIEEPGAALDLATVNADAYGLPLEFFDGASGMHLWRADSYGYVGYAAGRAVSAAATFPVNGTLYVALVATLAECQGKGYAETVMRKAIEEGSKGLGLRRVTLHATDMGRPLYAAMGFEEGARLGILALRH